MRRMLGVLRDEPAGAQPRRSRPTQPAAACWPPSRGSATSTRWSSACAAPGSTVSVEQAGRPFEVSGAAGLTVYRIVQEALTNALKHAEDPAAVEVRLDFEDPDISVRVRDDGREQAGRPCRPTPAPTATAAATLGRQRVRGRPRRGRDGRAGRRLRRHARAGPAASGGWEVMATLRDCKAPVAAVTVRVVLADDQALLRKGFRMILEAEDGIEIVGEAADGSDAVRLVELYRPDVVLMDVRMPVLDGIEATRAITTSAAGERDPGPDPHHLRPRRVRLQRAACRGQRLPAQGRAARRAGRRHPDGRPRRRGGLAARHPAPPRGVRRQAARPLRQRERPGAPGGTHIRRSPS